MAKVFGEDAGIAYGFGSVFDEVRQGVPVLSALFGVTGREHAAALDSLVYCQAWPTVAGGCMPSHLPPPPCPAYCRNHLLPHTLPPGRSGLPSRPPWTSWWWVPSPERCPRSGSLAIGEGKPRCWHCCAFVPSRRLLSLQSSLTQRCISAAAVPAVNCKLHPATPEQFSVSDGHSTEVSHCTRWCSMGAAVGNLVAYATQQHLNEKMGKDKVRVSLLGLPLVCMQSRTNGADGRGARATSMA